MTCIFNTSLVIPTHSEGIKMYVCLYNCGTFEPTVSCRDRAERVKPTKPNRTEPNVLLWHKAQDNVLLLLGFT